MHLILSSLRITAATMAICVVGYVGIVLGVAQAVTPGTANGSLITTPTGTIVGSRLIAQRFEDPGYFWPRPSAVDHDGAGAGGSNTSPTSEVLTQQAREMISRYGATPERPLPPELAAASAGGLDPHISAHAARYQVARVAGVRGITVSRLELLISARAIRPGAALTSDRIVNVLELNLALDSIAPRAEPLGVRPCP